MSRYCFCKDCDKATMPRTGRTEWYMVRDEVWHEANGGRGYLCIACLERRLGRQLTAADLTGAPINVEKAWDTPRLAAVKRRVPVP
jgi:hypothetical protein